MLPILGAALPPQDLAQHHNWLRDKPRDLELQGFHGDAVIGIDVKEKAEATKPLLDGMEGRIGIHGPFRGFLLDTEDADVRAVIHKRLTEGLDACGWLGATQMVIHSPVKAWHYENLDNADDGWEKFVERVHAALSPAVTRASDMGVEIVVENIEDRDPTARVRLVESFDSPAIKVSLDTGHAAYAHGIGNAPAVDRYVRTAGNQLTHVHVQDTDHFADRHWAIGDGELPWMSIFDELAKLTSNPRLIIEIKDKTAVQRSAAWLADRGLAQ
ncbi:MAG: sugar phosphate isomerase/epimerase family protein [Pseudomonadota bacterium]